MMWSGKAAGYLSEFVINKELIISHVVGSLINSLQAYTIVVYFSIYPVCRVSTTWRPKLQR